MDLAAPEAASATETKLHRIIIVGGGAGGLELATQLGNKLGRKGKAEITLVDRARTHIWKPLLHEIAAGSMDTGRHELPYQAQGHWHGFQYRYGEMIGLDRANKRVHLAATLRRGWPRDHAGSLVRLRYARHRHRQHLERFRHARRQRACDHARHARAGRAIQSAPAQRLRACQRAAGSRQAGPAARCHHRRRCDRHRAFGRVASRGARPRRFRARQDRPRKGHQDHADRSCAPHSAGAARAACQMATSKS